MTEPPSGIYAGVQGGLLDFFGTGEESYGSIASLTTTDRKLAYGQLTGIDRYMKSEQARMKAYEEPKEYLNARKKMLDDARKEANEIFDKEYTALVAARLSWNKEGTEGHPNEDAKKASPTGTIKYATNEELAQRAALKAQGDFAIKLEEINSAYPESFGRQALKFDTAKMVSDTAGVAFGLKK